MVDFSLWKICDSTPKKGRYVTDNVGSMHHQNIAHVDDIWIRTC